MQDKNEPHLSEMHFRQISYNNNPLESARLYCCWHDNAPYRCLCSAIEKPMPSVVLQCLPM